ncbi:MAG: hypothetical protein IPM26_17175 [Saprospiraceae bacterium]|nr:hypothetical protein [Saprospiraceae bacterium]
MEGCQDGLPVTPFSEVFTLVRNWDRNGRGILQLYQTEYPEGRAVSLMMSDWTKMVFQGMGSGISSCYPECHRQQQTEGGTDTGLTVGAVQAGR